MKPRKSSTPNRNATNAEILRALQDLNEKVAPIPKLVDDVQSLKQWKRDEEIAKRAVSEFVKQNPQVGPAAGKAAPGTDQWLNRELLKTLVYALAIIAALVALLKTGTHP